jgi:hypothetical protein
VILEALFTNPSSVPLIHPLLISPHSLIRHHTFAFLPQILPFCQRTSNTFSPEFSHFISQAFMLNDDPQNLSFTWIFISPILCLIKPDSFLDSFIANFQTCFDHGNFCSTRWDGDAPDSELLDQPQSFKKTGFKKTEGSLKRML